MSFQLLNQNQPLKNKTTDISELLGKTNTPQKKDTSEIEKLILEEIRKR